MTACNFVQGYCTVSLSSKAKLLTLTHTRI